MQVARHHYVVDGWGSGELWLDGGTVVAHDLEWGNCRGQSPAGTVPTLARDLIARVREQLAGRPTSFADVPLDLEWCTPFQASLAETLRDVPWGEVVSYGELAALAGRPGAARAAGSFCAENRFALFLPCHRVVAAAGIGGYGAAGVEVKRLLLALEGVEL